MPPRDPLRHFDFVEMIPEAGTYEPSSQAEMEAAEKEDEKIALAVPAPPPGISEFSVARYLFCNICYVSSKSPFEY